MLAYLMCKKWLLKTTFLGNNFTKMVNFACINLLQDGLNGFKMATKSHLKMLVAEMLTLKKQLNYVVQQLIALALELQKMNLN